VTTKPKNGDKYMHEYKLCYVAGCWAYFTTQKIEDQWGDDWDDAPYEHNAGEPYEDWKSVQAGLSPQWAIIKVAFDAHDLKDPSYGQVNSRYSVESINAGAIAWLASPIYVKEQVIIPAGTSLCTFKELVKKAGGKVYETK
jgi:hypothetical protein